MKPKSTWFKKFLKHKGITTASRWRNVFVIMRKLLVRVCDPQRVENASQRLAQRLADRTHRVKDAREPPRSRLETVSATRQWYSHPSDNFQQLNVLRACSNFHLLSKNSYLSKNFTEMITKTQLKETLEQFPEKFTLDELIDKIILLDKIERGNQQSENGEIILEEALDKEMQKWFK